MNADVIALALLIAEVRGKLYRLHPALAWMFMCWLRARIRWIEFRYSGRLIWDQK